MDFRDFLVNFDVLDICNLSPNAMSDMPRPWHVVEHHGKWQKGFNAGGQPAKTGPFPPSTSLVVVRPMGPLGAGRSSEVERSLMVRWVVGSILHGVDPLSYFSFQPVLHDWCNKGHDMCYPVCGMVHIKEPLLLIDKSSLCGGSGFPFSLSEWSSIIYLTPYNRR